MNRRRKDRSPRFPYLDPALDVDRRVSDLLGRMTLEEKVGQMGMKAKFRDLLVNGRVSAAALRRHYGRMSPGCIDDPRLKEIIDEIELRAEVEIAKLTRDV